MMIQGMIPGDKRPYVYGLFYPESLGGSCFYVGKGKKGRVHDHEQEAKGHLREWNTHKCRVIRSIWRKGEQIQKAIFAYFPNDDEAFLYEIALIFFMSNLTNKTNGGDGASGHIPSEETRRKRSETLKGRVYSEETLRKMSRAGKTSLLRQAHIRRLIEANTGRKLSEERKAEMSSRQIGKPLSEETRKKISIAHQGRKRTEETRRKLSNIAQNRSEETRRKISEANTGKHASEEARRNMSEAQKLRWQRQKDQKKGLKP